MRWDGQPAYHTFWPSSKHGIFPVRPHCTNARWNRWQEDSFYFGELEEITGTLSYCEWTVSSRTSNPITSPLGWSKKIWYAIKTKAPPIFFTLCTRTTVVKFQSDTATIKLCSITPHNLNISSSKRKWCQMSGVELRVVYRQLLSETNKEKFSLLS